MRYLLIFNFIWLGFSGNVFASGKIVSDPDIVFEKIYGFTNDAMYDSAIREAGAILPQLDDVNKAGEAYFVIAYSHERSGRPFQAIKYYLKASEHFTLETCLSNTFENIGLIYKGFNQQDKAIYYFNKAVALQKAGSQERMKKLYSRSTSLRRYDRTDLALMDLLEAEEIAYETGAKVFRAKIYNQLGLAFKFRGELSKAGSYFFQALEIAETRDIYHNYANLKLELGDTVQAEEYFLKAISLSEKPALISSYIDLGEMYLLWGKREQAYLYLQKAHKKFRESNDRAFNHIKLFEALAKAETDELKADLYKDRAIAEYKESARELIRSNELFFGVIADEKLRSLEIKRAHAESSREFQIIIILGGLITLVLVVWLIYRIRKSAKEKNLRRFFDEIQHIFYEE